MQVILPSLPLASFQGELVDLCESFKPRYISIQEMNYYVCPNMFAYENLLLHILFGLWLLSVLFCSDSHYGVLSKDFIYGCLVRNRELDPSLGDNFKCLYLNVRYHYRCKQLSRNFKLAIPISKRQDNDSSHWPSHIHYLVFILLYAWMFISILEGLPFVQKTGNSEKNLNGTVHPGGNVPEKQ